MKVRKLAVALALAGGLGSGVAQALGLGQIELQSYLNEPLDAEIVLPQSRGVSPGDVLVNIASDAAYERVGLDRGQFLSKLRFEVVTGTDGNLVVNVSSREPLREPYLNFLLELTWPNGRLMREYAVLVDPPVYAEESGVREQVAAPSSTTRTFEPAAQTTRSSESIRRQAEAESSLGRGYSADTLGPTGPSDTLWTIAQRVRPDNSVSMQQVMLAIQDLNPNAFIGGNINRLKRGEVLRVPTKDQIQSRTRAEATRIVSQQNQEFQSPQRTVDATQTPQPAQPTEQAAAGAGDAELKLLVAEESDSRDSTEGGSAGGDSDLPGGVDAGEAIAMEELESARRENAELNSRVEDLQDQVETLQRLIELKNSQLADLQQMAGEDDAQAVAGETGAPGEGETAATASAEDGAESGSEEAGTGEMSETVASAAGSESAGDEAEQAGAATETEVATEETVAEEGSGDAAQAFETAETGDTTSSEAASDIAGTGAEPADAAAAGDDAAAAGQESEQDAAAAAPAQQQTQPAQQPVAPQKAFPGNIIDMIVNNPMYQIALGGGLILLLLLLLLVARRNANREKEFYDELNADSEGESDSFEVDLGEEETKAPEAGDALAEADRYVAYGQTDQAVQSLENAISREPSRTDLRLKLLALYADNQDRQGFEKQFGEIEAFEDEDALAEANALRSRLEEAESVPSIDDLESQLRSDSFSTDQEEVSTDVEVSDELLADQYDASKEEQVENEFGDFDTEFAEFDLSDVEQAEKKSDAAADEDEPEVEAEGETADTRDDMIEFDLSALETEEQAETEAQGEETDFSSLEMDLEEPAEESREDQSDEFSLELEDESGKPAEGENEEVESELSGLDESFLDELDAELDKVADEDELGGDEMEESSLDDLELDVSDEDLALMEEFSDSADTTNHGEDEPASLDEELGLEDTLGEGDVMGEGEEPSPEQEVAETEELEDLGTLENLAEQEAPAADEAAEEEIPVASDEAPRPAPVDIDESELGEDDDFDFLAGTDEAATKLDLARAYIEMGDSDGARDILEEVALEGDDAQKAEAQDLLKNLS